MVAFVLLRLAKFVLVLALSCSIGSHWAFLQSLAWTSMLAANLRRDSLAQAVFHIFASVAVLAAVLAPGAAWGCACGCGVFDVATSSMLPNGPGGMLYVQYDYQDQNMFWGGASPQPSKLFGLHNNDQDIRTDFTDTGVQYMFNRQWGLQVELPYDVREYRNNAGWSSTWNAFGDLRVQGIYSGFFPDMSAGVTFGLKLPTGDDTHDDATPSSLLDRDVQLGTGSTDVLLGGYYRHTLNSLTPGLFWFAQAQLDVPALIQGGYRPGVEMDTAFGLYYQRMSLGKVQMTPVAQVIPSLRTKDTGSWASGGANAPGSYPGDPTEVDSGYERVLLSPGLEFDVHPLTIYADVEFNVYDRVKGYQLAAPEMFKVLVTYHF
jgi:hypothetical protein